MIHFKRFNNRYINVYPFQHHLVVTPTACSVADWSESFKRHGWSTCEEDNLFITGFYRLNPPNQQTDPISSLEQAKCCTGSKPEFRSQDGTCTTASWWHSLERCVSNTNHSLHPECPHVVVACMDGFWNKIYSRGCSKREPLEMYFK